MYLVIQQLVQLSTQIQNWYAAWVEKPPGGISDYSVSAPPPLSLPAKHSTIETIMHGYYETWTLHVTTAHRPAKWPPLQALQKSYVQ